MAGRADLTPHQRGLVRRYYEHRDEMMVQKVSEIVSELYTCTDEKKAGRLWRSARTALLHLHPGKARVESVIAQRDLTALAQLVGEVF